MERKKNNGFLITWVSCIVFLLVLCFFGVNNSLKGTRASSCGAGETQKCGYVGSMLECWCVSTGGGNKPNTDNDKPSGGGGGGGGGGSDSSKGNSYDNLSDCQSSGKSCYYNSSDGKYYDYPYYENDNKPNTDNDKPSGSGNNQTNSGSRCKNNDVDNCKKVTYEDGSYSEVVTNEDGSESQFNYVKKDGQEILLSNVKKDKYGNVIEIIPGKDSALPKVEITTPSTSTSDGSYSTTQINSDGSKIVRKYNKVGQLVSADTYDSNGTKTSTTQKKVFEEDGSYYTEQVFSDGTIVRRAYSKDGKELSIVTITKTVTPSGTEINEIVVEANDGSVLKDSKFSETIYSGTDKVKESKWFFKEESSCEEIMGISCVKSGDYYVSDEEAKNSSFGDKETCEETTGDECTDSDNDGDWESVKCDCGDKGCDPIVPPSPRPTGNDPTIPPSDPNDGKDVTDEPNLPNNPNSPDNPPTSNDGNVTENPQTGEIAMFMILIIGFGAVGYSIWYYMKNRKES